MKFDELDDKMRVYETALDTCVLPEMFVCLLQTSVTKAKKARLLSPPSSFYLRGDFDGGRASAAMILDESRQDTAEIAGFGSNAAAAIFTHSARSENH